MAWYQGATRKNIPPGPNDPPIKARVVILHVAATEADSLFGYFNGPSGGVESHFYIKYDGTVEQYRDTAYQADANVMANDFAISVETQGLANGTWTPQQLDAIKALLAWCHTVHGVPLVKCPRWDGAGVGYHVLFEAQWDQRGAVCPGPNRIKQFDNVLVPWMVAGGQETDVPLTDDDAATIWLHGSKTGKSAWALLAGANAQVTTLSAAVKALAEAKGADADAITKAVVDKINALDLTITTK